MDHVSPRVSTEPVANTRQPRSRSQRGESRRAKKTTVPQRASGTSMSPYQKRYACPRPRTSSAAIRRTWVRHGGTVPSTARPGSMTMLAPRSMAKIAMNFPSANSDVASHIHQLTPRKSPYAVGFQRASMGNANIWMWTASIPSTPTPRSTSSDLILIGAWVCATLSASESCAPGSVFVASEPSVTRGFTPRRDTQAVRLQHCLDVLSAALVIDPRPSPGRIQDNAGALGGERAVQVLVEALLVVRNDQQGSQLAQ